MFLALLYISSLTSYKNLKYLFLNKRESGWLLTFTNCSGCLKNCMLNWKTIQLANFDFMMPLVLNIKDYNYSLKKYICYEFTAVNIMQIVFWIFKPEMYDSFQRKWYKMLSISAVTFIKHKKIMWICKSYINFGIFELDS